MYYITGDLEQNLDRFAAILQLFYCCRHIGKNENSLTCVEAYGGQFEFKLELGTQSIQYR